ncbi:MAG: alpha/beta fold hydrolase [Dehalococcoidia bacterium]|nr:alpha/beta fold hydrolase [Dehalococcoidia bacterium]
MGGRHVLRRALAWLAPFALVPLAVACGESKSAEPSPAAVATAEALSRAVTITAPSGTTPEAGGGSSSVRLAGHIFGSGPVGVILVHGRPTDQTAWFPYATQLAASGTYTVLTFDFRGFGDSKGEKDFNAVDTDLTAAYRYMRDDLGRSRIFLVGASIGGTASLVVATRLPVAGVVSISSPGEFPPLDATEAVQKLAVPKLFIVSKNDVPQAIDQATMVAAAPQPKEAVVYEGTLHGTDLLQGPHAREVEQRITAFLGNN